MKSMRIYVIKNCSILITKKLFDLYFIFYFNEYFYFFYYYYYYCLVLFFLTNIQSNLNDSFGFRLLIDDLGEY